VGRFAVIPESLSLRREEVGFKFRYSKFKGGYLCNIGTQYMSACLVKK
jgi:hypothetical protein